MIDNQRLRVWDRSVLNLLVNRHTGVFGQYFKDYPIAVDELFTQVHRGRSARHRKPPQTATGVSGPLAGMSNRPGHFSQYEKIGIDIFAFLFPESLGDPKPQDRTADGKQRRDVLFRNKRIGGFWQRIFHRFDADLLVVDFKNYGEPVTADVIFDVEKYANKALGRFVMVVSRHGADQTVERHNCVSFETGK